MRNALTYVVLLGLMLLSVPAMAQEKTDEEGKKLSGEFTARYRVGFFTEGPMITGGIRMDEKHTVGIFLGHEELWDDATPANIYSYRAGLVYRWNNGRRKAVSFYSEIYAGAGYVYKVDGVDTDNSLGDLLFVGGWQPGVRFGVYNNFHIFLGPTFGTDCIGLHLGFGF